MSATEYEQFFGFRAKPFELVPNPEFLYMSKTHRKAMTYLEYGISERAGFILLTGEVGSGKTTLVRNLIRKLDRQVVLSKVFNTRVNSDQLIAMINDDFGLEAVGKDKTALLRDLYDFLIAMYSKGLHPVLIIDEAQNLSWELLEEVRMLSNLETDNAKLLQIILVGQPELKAMLSKPELRQFRQRINVSCHLYHLLRHETEEYILHRLEVAGNRHAVEFTPEALDLVHEGSRGVPRLINIICDFLLLTAFTDRVTRIDAPMAREILDDLEFESRFWDGLPEAELEPSGPAEGAPAASADISAFAVELRAMVKELSARVEALEKRSPVQDITVPKELSRRIDRIERLLEDHCEKSHAVPERSDDRPEPYDTVVRYSTRTDGEKVSRKGFLQRFFG